jgi:hypothetical protein
MIEIPNDDIPEPLDIAYQSEALNSTFATEVRMYLHKKEVESHMDNSQSTLNNLIDLLKT